MSKSFFSFIIIVTLILMLCFTFSCQQQVEEGITEEEAKALAESSLEIWNEGNLALIEEVYAPEYVRHDSAFPEDIVGLDDFKKLITFMRTAYPDFKVTFDDMIVKGDKVVVRWTMIGTNTGPRGDLPPTGKKVRISGISMSRIVNGKTAEEWEFYNSLDVALQLGFTLTPPQPPEVQEEKK
jgi:steroid delta-isomerase-like uncharacterized protein